MPDERPTVRDQALEVARGWSGPDAPASWLLTEALFGGLARDATLLRLAADIATERLPPLLFVASVQYLVARYPGEELAAYFPSGSGQRRLDAGFAEHYRAFCLEHEGELRQVWDQHVYQMNEVARTTQIALALGVVRRLRPDRPVALIDVGTGAGFGLYPDRYRYVLNDRLVFGSSSSPVELACDVRGDLRPSVRELPPIDRRIGIDVNPIDLDDPAAREWLQACLPPDTAALRRMRDATEVVRRGDAKLVRAESERALPEALASVPRDVLTVVVDAYTAVFFDRDARRVMRELIDRSGRHRDIAWISLDPLVPLGTQARDTVQGEVAPAQLVDTNRRGGVFAVLSVVAHLGGEGWARLLGTAHPSGTRMEWLDSDTAR